MLQGILIIVVFLVIAALMMTKKIPTLLALPLMAVIICIIAGVPAVGTDAEGNAIGWLQTVVENGTVRMGSAIMAVIFGAWLGQLMNKTGVTENIIKKSAELGGDRPLVVTLIMVVAVAILFTTLSGLGSIIMVGSIVLPILVSVGVPAISAACIFLMAFTTGLTFNIANWKSFSSIFGLEIEQIKSFEIYLLIATLIATLVLVFVEFKKNGVKFAFSAPVSDVPETRQLKGVAGTLAMLTPLVPILLVALLKVPVVPAFVAGIIWVLVFTSKSFSKAMNLLVKTCYDGITDAGPAVILMIGIGILYLAVTHSMVKEVLNPFLLAVIPSNRIAYIIFFSLLAPLSLYRGPMNLFGLGSGIAALVIGLGTLSPLAVMGAFLAAERVPRLRRPDKYSERLDGELCGSGCKHHHQKAAALPVGHRGLRCGAERIPLFLIFYKLLSAVDGARTARRRSVSQPAPKGKSADAFALGLAVKGPVEQRTGECMI